MNIIIDSNNLCHIAFHSVGMSHLSNDEQETGIIFGFLNILFYTLKTVKIDKPNLFFCWDSKRSLRKRIYPEYKNNRRKDDKTEEEKELYQIAYDQFDELKEKVLPKMGFMNNYQVSGLEADDLIAIIARKKKLKGKYKVIVSTDQDLFQLLSNRTTIYNPRTKIGMNDYNFTNIYGLIDPLSWIRVKAIAGCASDNIKGIEKVGEKTAIKYINEDLNKKSKAYKSIRKGKDIIELNKKLVSLPFKHVNLPQKIDKINMKEIKKIFDKYWLSSFLRKIDEWEDLLLN
jgi:DNA polymerase I